jgi:hypothetical protein
MGVNASRVKYMVDAAAAVVLRDIADGAEAPSGSSIWEAAKSLNELREAYWHDKEIPNGVFAIEIEVTAVTLSTNSYKIGLRVDDVEAQNNNPVVIQEIPIKGVGVYHMYVDSKDIPNFDPDSDGTGKWIAVGVTENGTPASPSITYGARMVKVVAP